MLEGGDALVVALLQLLDDAHEHLVAFGVLALFLVDSQLVKMVDVLQALGKLGQLLVRANLLHV